MAEEQKKDAVPPKAVWEKLAENLLELEQETIQMISCPQEEWVVRMRRREELMEQIGSLEAQRRAAGDEGQRQTGQAAVFEAQARAAAGRLRELDVQLLGRMKGARDKILEQIKAVEKSAGAKASRYYRPAAPASTFHNSI